MIVLIKYRVQFHRRDSAHRDPKKVRTDNVNMTPDFVSAALDWNKVQSPASASKSAVLRSVESVRPWVPREIGICTEKGAINTRHLEEKARKVKGIQ